MRILFFCVGFLCCSVTSGQDSYSCYWIIQPTVDCDNFAPEPTCGSNLVTYKNRCTYSKAHCADPKISVKHYGDCTPADGTTPTPINVDGVDVVFDFFCTNLSHMNCPVGGEKVCADDGYTYANYCEYEKQKCTHRRLQVLDCPVAGATP
ncbi:follistatin-like [Ruditapes philippinarum]|uniref:follistatin-like n=1 Tax=Ruditapes philippinarum TaxID=129788 RepID=UPI00295A622F|nr:follistatin-like [Ruditapes philippinarum]